MATAQPFVLYDVKALKALHGALLEEKRRLDAVEAVLSKDPLACYGEYRDALVEARALHLDPDRLAAAQQRFDSVRDPAEVMCVGCSLSMIGERSLVWGCGVWDAG